MHRIATRLFRATIALVILAGLTASLHAQQGGTTPRRNRATAPRSTKKRPPTKRVRQAAAEGRAARPRGNAVMQEQKLSADMIQILKDWEVETAKHQRMTAIVEKYIYDSVFYTEKRGIGEIKFEQPDKASLKLMPMKIPVGEKSQKKDPKGNPYELDGVTPERWVCTGKEIFQIDDKEETFRVVLIPPNMRGQQINEGPIPFLFGLKAEEAKKRYRFFDLKPPPGVNIPNSFWFRAEPRRQVDRQEYKYADVVLDIKRFVPIAIRLVDPPETTTTVYRFDEKKIEINPKQGFFGIGGGKFIDPDLKGYKIVGNADPAPPPGAQLPADKRRIAQPRATDPEAGRTRITDGPQPTRK